MNWKKQIWSVLLLFTALGQVYADEGMWVLKELNKQNLARMKELGFTPRMNSCIAKRIRVWQMPLLSLVADVPVLPFHRKD